MLFAINAGLGESVSGDTLSGETVQTLIVLAAILCAATYVVRHVWWSWRGTSKPGCGSCGGCGSDGDTRTSNGFVSLDALKPPPRPRA